MDEVVNINNINEITIVAATHTTFVKKIESGSRPSYKIQQSNLTTDSDDPVTESLAFSLGEKIIQKFGKRFGIPIIILICIIVQSVSVANIIISAVFLYECKAAYGIPVWLLAFGIFGFCLGTYFLISWFLTKGQQKLKSKLFYQRLVFSLYIVFWLICGSTLVYLNYPKFSNDYSSPYYCNPILYNYSFSILIVCWIVWILNFFSFFFY